MQPLVAVLLILVAIAVLYALSVKINVPYPTLFVLGGLLLAFIPGLPRIQLDADRDAVLSADGHRGYRIRFGVTTRPPSR